MAPRSVADSLRIFAFSVYVASLLFPPYITSDPAMQESGFSVLILGWVSMLPPPFITAWLANPLMIFCFFRMKATPRLCVVLSVLAILAAHDFASIESLGWDSSREVAAGTVRGLGAGSLLWLAALALTLAASIAFIRKPQPVAEGLEEEFEEEEVE
jgi:hypothetical protein